MKKMNKSHDRLHFDIQAMVKRVGCLQRLGNPRYLEMNCDFITSSPGVALSS